MNSLIIKTMQVIVLVNIWLSMLLGVIGGVAVAYIRDTGSGVSLGLGATTISITSPGSYLFFGFVGLILMFLFVVPFYALWVLMYSNNKLLIQIERNTATMANATINADHHQSSTSPIDDCLRADPR
ncbi:hypothetical protein [Pseudomonas izuensis]|uniref:hypothetical protein n=1 Tax=Pseudomonas izuensis TaxID=2684212 RepID=UPI00135B844B|nr:hypothetical protein [Pseudomonas izuensis]